MHKRITSSKRYLFKKIIKLIFGLFFLITFSLHAESGRSDTPVITSDLCGISVLTKVEGTSTETAGSIIEVFVRTSIYDATVSLGTATVNADGSWQLPGINISSGLISATATAPNEAVSLPTAEIELSVPPIITQGILSNPTLCGAFDGTVELLGFLPFAEYDLYYTDESGFQSLTLTADALGSITISGLGEGQLQEIYAEWNGCVTNTICSIELDDPTIPTFTLGVPVQPLICGGTGEILISGAPLQALDYEVSYFDGTSTVGPVTITSSVLGIITITSLVSGTYSDFQVSRNGCSAGLIPDNITIYDGVLPLVAGLITQPTCSANDGSIQVSAVGLNDLATYDVHYEDESGITQTIVGLSPSLGIITIPNLAEGVFRNLRVEDATGCVTNPLSTINLSVLPTISLLSEDGPINCLSADGSIVLTGLVPSGNYDIEFELDGVSQAFVSVTADGITGEVELNNLSSGSYSNIYVTQGNCQSNILDDIIFFDEISTPEITLGTPVLPSACALTDGSITLLGLPITNQLYDVSYVNSLGLQTIQIMSSAGEITIGSLPADEYADINVSINGCESNTLVCPINLDVVPSASLGVVIPVSSCGASDGSITILGLEVGENYDITYRDSNGIQNLTSVNSGLGTITISGLPDDTYSDLTVTLGGCSSEPLADISLGSLRQIAVNTFSNPTSCGATDGSIVLSGLAVSTSYDVSYTTSAGVTTINLTSGGTGLLNIPNLGAGDYSALSVNDGSACDSNSILDVTSLIEVGVPAIALGTTVNPSGCGLIDGEINLAGLLANTTYDVFYENSLGAQTVSILTDALGVLPITGLGADDYQDVYVELGGCQSNYLSDIITLSDIGTPVISLGTITPPSFCGAADGIIELTGLALSTAYDVIYTNSLGIQPPVTINSDLSGNLLIENLAAEFYENIKVSLGGCFSVSVGPVDLECDNEAIYTIDDQTIDALSDSDILAYPTDLDGGVACASILSGTLPAGVSFDVNTGEIFVSVANDLVVGQTTLNIETIDVEGNTTVQDVTFEILNDTPVANDDSYSVDEGASINVNDADGSGGDASVYGVIVNDTDIAFTSLTVTKLTDPTNHSGTFTLNADGTFVYTHDGSETTSDSFTYRLSDGLGETDDATVTITINPINDPPVAVADSYTFDEGSTNNVNAAAGVLANDDDADGDTMSAILVTDVSNGTLTLNADGSFTYVHDGSETTSDSFTYKVNDGTVDGNTVTVTLTIDPVNDTPVAVADSYTFDEGSTNNVNAATGVLANDDDADGDTMSAILVTDVSNGTLTLNLDGSFTYVHDGSETTSDSFTYKVNDGTVDGNTVTVTLTIDPVNDTPVAVADSYTFDEGSTNNVNAATGVLANDDDADGDTMSAILVTDVSNGTLTLNSDGSFIYVHDGSETTSDSFTYKVNDGTVDGNTVTVTLTIDPLNDTPVAVADSYTFDEGSTNNVNAATGVLVNDTDGDGDTMSAILVTDVSNGTLTLNLDGSFTYVHDGSETTSDSFTYKVNDGTVDGNTVMVTISINPINDIPFADNDSANVNEGEIVSIDVANGDTDSDGTIVLNSITIVSNPSNGSLIDNADGTITYTHNGSETTSDSFNYTIEDNDGAVSNVATVSISINSINDIPLTVADAITVNNGGTKTILDGGNTSVLDNDIDDENDLLNAILVSDVANGTLLLNTDGTFSYTHDGSATTTDSFEYKANDGVDGNTVTVSIVINATNAPPVADDEMEIVDEGESISIDVANGDSDVDGSLNLNSITIVTSPTNGSVVVSGGGLVEYSHDGSETIGDSFSYTIEDDLGAVSNVAMVTISVTPVNDAPFADDDSESNQFMQSVIVNVVDGDIDVDGVIDVMSIVIIDQPSQGVVTINGDGTITYLHNGLNETVDTFTYTVNDNEGAVSNVATVDITVLPEEDELLDVPDVFTPNGDGTNDFWLIPNIESYPNNVVKVFNRWGNEIIEIKGYDNASRIWDSTSDGRMNFGSSEAPDGTYFYLIELLDENVIQSGFIVISR